jgi:PAS domain S-box-containing protein
MTGEAYETSMTKKAPPILKNTALVTERLVESEKLFRGIFENTGTPLAVIEEDTSITFVNARFEELSGYSRGEIEGKKHWPEFVAPDDIDRFVRYHTGMLKPGGLVPAHYTFGFLDRAGTVRDVSVTLTMVAGTRKIVLTLADIAPRKKIERLLRLHEERYNSLVKTLNTGVFRATRDLPGRFIWANPAFAAMLGYRSLTELLRITTNDIFADPGDQDRIRSDLTNSGFAWLQKIRLKTIDGTLIWASVTAEVRRNETGAVEWIDGTIENITERVQALEELQRTRSRLGELLDAVTTYSLIATDSEGILTVFNTGSERMLGYRADELVGRETPLVFLDPEELAGRARLPGGEAEHAGFEVFVAQAKANGCDEREWTYVRKDGVKIPVDLTLTVMRSEEGAVTGFLGVAQEISDRKRLEEAFRSDKLQMSGVIYNIPDPTFAIDREGKVIAWNRAIEELSGVKAVDILGRGGYAYAVPFYGDTKPTLANLIFATDTVLAEHGYFNIRRAGNSLSAETRLVKLGGKDLVIQGIAAPIYNAAGEIAGTIETITDITEVRRRESELLDSESRHRAILDYIGSAIAILEEDATLSYINPEFERIIGYVRDEVEGKKKWTEFVAPEDQERMRDYQRRRRTEPDGVPTRYECRFIRWDGQVRNGFLTITLIPGSGKTVVSLLDITDRVLAGEAMQRANKKLNFFSSIIRHDILNQLTSLKGNLELSRESVADPAFLKSVDKELAAAEAIQSRILFTRDYQDIGIQPPSWQDIREVILASCRGIKLGKVMVDVDIAGVGIYADLLLVRVFYHLIDNAIRYGGPVSRIRFFCQESFDELLLVCEDNGIGIAERDKEKIFSRRDFGSPGLAMYVAREILSITGITIRETGVPGSGARFEIRVPKGAYRFVTGS